MAATSSSIPSLPGITSTHTVVVAGACSASSSSGSGVGSSSSSQMSVVAKELRAEIRSLEDHIRSYMTRFTAPLRTVWERSESKPSPPVAPSTSSSLSGQSTSATAAGSSATATATATSMKHLNLRQRHQLRGHFGQVYSIQWAPDSRHFLSASQDGTLIVWSPMESTRKKFPKLGKVRLRSSWVLTCAWSLDQKFICSGGLDNVVSIYASPLDPHGWSVQAEEWKKADPTTTFNAVDPTPLRVELAGHTNYVSSVRWIDHTHLATASGDGTVMVWDVEHKRAIHALGNHPDLMCVRVLPTNHNILLASGVDPSPLMWDTRLPGALPIMKFFGHTSDVDNLACMSNGLCFASAGYDASMRLWDIRSSYELNRFEHPPPPARSRARDRTAEYTGCAFSLTGRWLFGTVTQFYGEVWDTLTGTCVQVLEGHENRVTGIDVTNDGKALAMCAWDTLISVWA